MKINKIHHIAIIASDYQKSKTFYVEVLGLKVLSENYRVNRKSHKLDLALGEHYIIELFTFENPPKRLSHPEATGLRHLAFEVDGVSETRNELLSKGVHCEEIRTDELTGKSFFFASDPDDLPLEFYQK